MPSHAATYASEGESHIAVAPVPEERPASERGDALQEPAATRYPFAEPAQGSISLNVVQGLLRLYDATAIVASAGGVTALMRAFGFAVADWVLMAALVGALFVMVMTRTQGYDRRVLRQDTKAAVPVAKAWLASAACVAAALALAGALHPAGAAWYVVWSAACFGLLLAGRAIAEFAMRRWRVAGRLVQNIAVVGTCPSAMRLLSHLDRCAGHDIRIDGVYTEQDLDAPRYFMGHPIRGSIDELIQSARRRRIDAVVLCPLPGTERRLQNVQSRLREIAADIHVHLDGLDAEASAAFGGVPNELCGMPMLTVERLPLKGWAALAKTVEDRVIAAMILAMISPLLLIIAALIKLDSPGPVFFSQRRYGLNNEPIRILKFRTLRHNAKDTFAGTLVTRNDARVTRLGGFLRKTSLDELPQFLNVLRGEMSIVGPRPHAAAAKAGGLLYDEAVEGYYARHRVKPGITGWAQINGWRGETRTVAQIKGRVDHDLYYIENWSVLFDLRIIVQTILRGFTGHQAY